MTAEGMLSGNKIRRPLISLNPVFVRLAIRGTTVRESLWRFFLMWSIALLLQLFGTQHVEADSSTTAISIFKERQILELYKNGNLKKTYRICLGTNPKGPKRVQGDSKTPEGNYFVCSKNLSSRFHRFLGLSYPGTADAQWAFETGRICLDERDSIINQLAKGLAPPWDTPLGGWVGIHGYPTGSYETKWTLLLFPKPHNWTDGCIAMWNFEIEELFANVALNTPVTIKP